MLKNQSMKKGFLFFIILLLIIDFQTITAQNNTHAQNGETTAADSVKRKRGLTIGGYGEAVYKYNFYSDNMFRYSHADKYADSKGHGRVDLPHAVFMMSYDFGKGWTFNAEIEFEHGGTESAVEVEAEETGEFEKEIERGGGVGQHLVGQLLVVGSEGGVGTHHAAGLSHSASFHLFHPRESSDALPSLCHFRILIGIDHLFWGEYDFRRYAQLRIKRDGTLRILKERIDYFLK